MWKTAKISGISFSFLLLNLALVVTVAILRPVLAAQQSGETSVTPEVEVPADPPSLPAQATYNSAESAVSMPKVSAPGPATPPNQMVMDEILKVIQDGRGELDVPPLSYPNLPLKTYAGSASADLQQLSQRMKSIAQLTQSAQALIAEAQQLKSAGQASAAQALTEHVQTLRSIIVQLAAEGADVGPTPQGVTRTVN